MPRHPRVSRICSLEQLLLLSATAVEGTDGADWLTNCGENAVIRAYGGDDEIYAPVGTNQIDGGDGNDVLVIYEGKRSDFLLQKRADGSVLLEGVGRDNEWVSNTLTNVERISFRDGMLWVGDETERTLNGTAQNDFLSGAEFTDMIQAFAGDDAIYAPFQVQQIDGGAGLDTLIVYEGRLADYTVTAEADGGVRIQGPGLNGTVIDNLLVNVERILFNDQLLDLRDIGPDTSPDATSSPDASPPATSSPSTAPNTPVQEAQPDTTPLAEDRSPDLSIDSNPADAEPVQEQTELHDQQSEQQEGNSENPVGTEPLAPEPIAPEPPSASPGEPSQEAAGASASERATGAESSEAESAQVPTEPPASDASGADTPVTEPPANLSEPEPVVPAFVQQVVDLTNEFRTRNGLDPLAMNAELQQAAQGHSRDLAISDYFSHISRDGRQPWDRAASQGYNYLTIGENIAAGQLTPQQVVQAWIDSPPHLQNLLNPNFTEIGVGYEYLENDTGDINYNHYWTQLFGTEIT